VLLRLIEAANQLADVRCPVVRPLAFGVGVVDDETEAGSATGCCPLQHLKVAVRVAKGDDRAAPDRCVDGDWLAFLVVDETVSGRSRSRASAVWPRAPITVQLIGVKPMRCWSAVRKWSLAAILCAFDHAVLKDSAVSAGNGGQCATATLASMALSAT